MIDEERKQKSQEILQSKGYKIIEFLGQGAYSTVFKCENNDNELVAAKVTIGTDIDIQKEISTANELDLLKGNGWDKYKGKLEKADKHYQKYLNKPVFKGKIAGSNCESIAIFEVPLVDDDMWNSIVMSNVKINYEGLKKLAKNVLKALQIIHSKNKVHSDIQPSNIYGAKWKNDKNIFQLGDFGKMRDAKDEKDKKTDIFALGKTLIALYIAEFQNQLYILKIGKTEIHNVEQCIKDLQDNKYQFVSDNPKEKLFLEFVKKLTIKDYNKRPDASEALKDKFLVKS